MDQPDACPDCGTAMKPHCANDACTWLQCANVNCRTVVETGEHGE